jgi:hypothetical protein
VAVVVVGRRYAVPEPAAAGWEVLGTEDDVVVSRQVGASGGGGGGDARVVTFTARPPS